MGNKIAIPEGYGLVRSITAPHESIVQNVKIIREATGRSVGQSKELLAQETPFVLILEEITKLQDAGFICITKHTNNNKLELKEKKLKKN